MKSIKNIATVYVNGWYVVLKNTISLVYPIIMEYKSKSLISKQGIDTTSLVHLNKYIKFMDRECLRDHPLTNHQQFFLSIGSMTTRYRKV